MTDQPAQPQFDRAEFEGGPPATACAVCSTPLISFYYEANGQTVCEACKYQLESARAKGSSASRAGRAIGAGFGAAVLGALLYYAIAAISGYEFGLIAIAVGWGVGTAVRWGSNNRGGWRYQAIAMALTYLAIVGTYIPPLVQAILSTPEQVAADAMAGEPGAAAAVPVSIEAADVDDDAAAGAPSVAFSVVFLLVLACAAPFLGGLENIMGLVIIGIGLYEAWTLNKRVHTTITGPHALGRPASV